MTSARLIDTKRQSQRQANRRWRLRKAGLLPPMPTCLRCGAMCINDNWLPLCSLCARRCGLDLKQRNQYGALKYKFRPLRIAAEKILLELRDEAWLRLAAEKALLELRAEARAEAGSVTDRNGRAP